LNMQTVDRRAGLSLPPFFIFCMDAVLIVIGVAISNPTSKWLLFGYGSSFGLSIDQYPRCKQIRIEVPH
jgi:hypothetical protein